MSDVVDDAVRTVFRDVMSGVSAPVTVVSSMAGDRVYGTTVSAFSSLSLDPPMVLVALNRTSRLLALIEESRRFGVNVLAAGQSDLAGRFARQPSVKDFSGFGAWRTDHRVPRLAGTVGWVACDVVDLVPGGDHLVVLGSVVAAETSDGDPLIYYRRRYGTHVRLDPVA
jgi:flavin reductase (DIM6/NTAB) family NADH-FMN oxidoreductase RutF